MPREQHRRHAIGLYRSSVMLWSEAKMPDNPPASSTDFSDLIKPSFLRRYRIMMKTDLSKGCLRRKSSILLFHPRSGFGTRAGARSGIEVMKRSCRDGATMACESVGK